MRLLEAAFDVTNTGAVLVDNHASSLPLGFHRTAYHKHVGTFHHNDNNDNNHHNATSSSSLRISFQLHDPETHPLTNKYNLYVKCPLGKVTVGKKKVPTGEFRSGELPPSLLRVEDDIDSRGIPRSGRVLDFTVSISTNLKILLIGDSVMVQLAQAFDEMAMMGTGHHNSYNNHPQPTRSIVWEAWRGHNGGTIAAPTLGGGATALWRMTALLSKSRKGKPPANSAGGGWSDTEIDALLGHSYQGYTTTTTNSSSNKHNSTVTIGNFDVVVFRVMHGWMKSHEITHDRVVEAIELSHELLGATTVVLMTVPFTNNVITVEEILKVKEINNDIREIARTWHTRTDYNGGVQNVLVLEYGTYYNHIIWSSAIHLGYNVTPPLRATEQTFDNEGPTFLLDRLQNVGEWPASISMVCSDTSSLGTERNKCDRNYLYLDGMHTCPETLASRYGVGLACLIGCAYNGRRTTNNSNNGKATNANREEDGQTINNNNDNDNVELHQQNMRACEQECNAQFLSVMPLEEDWIDTNTTLASFSG